MGVGLFTVLQINADLTRAQFTRNFFHLLTVFAQRKPIVTSPKSCLHASSRGTLSLAGGGATSPHSRRSRTVGPCKIWNRLHEMVWHQQRALYTVGETPGYHSSHRERRKVAGLIVLTEQNAEKADVGGAGGVREPWSTVRHHSRLCIGNLSSGRPVDARRRTYCDRWKHTIHISTTFTYLYAVLVENPDFNNTSYHKV